MLMGRRPRSRLHLSVAAKMESQQIRQTVYHDSTCPSARTFSVNDPVFARNFSGNPPKWLPGTVSKVTGSFSCKIVLQQGGIIRRHIDAVRSRDAAFTTELEEDEMGLFPHDFLQSRTVATSGRPPATNSLPSTPLRHSTRTTHPPYQNTC